MRNSNIIDGNNENECTLQQINEALEQHLIVDAATSAQHQQKELFVGRVDIGSLM